MAHESGLARISSDARRVLSWGDLGRGAGLGPTLRHLRATRNRQNLGSELVSRGYERIWNRASEELGAECVPLGRDFLEIRLGGAITRVRRSTTMLDDAVTLGLAGDKEIGQGLLAANGLAVPESVTLESLDVAPALELLGRSPAGCAVKPAAGSGAGRGVTCGMRTPQELALAVRRAAGFGSRILIEPMVPGDDYRLLFLDGELLDVVRRERPAVTGDGRSSVGRLMLRENERRIAAKGKAGSSLLRLDLDCLFTLRHAGLTLQSVPHSGAHVTVKTVANDNGAHENTTVRDGLAPELVREAAAGAAALGVRLAGVDVITPDVTRPLAEVGGAINEVNTTPGLHHHYEVADGANATPVAVPILRALLGAGVREPAAVAMLC